MKEYNCDELSQMIGCTKQTVLNWIHNGWLSPARKDDLGFFKFSEEQYNNIKNALPLPKYSKRKEWLSQFNVPTVCEELKPTKPIDKSIYPPMTNNPGSLYATDNKSESAKKISDIVTKSNILLRETLTHKVDIHNLDKLTESTCEYFDFCAQNGIMPSMRRLANWYGYSFKRLYQLIDIQSPTGQYLDQIKDAIKDNLEQAALVNAVNNISAMFILKSQYDYVEATKVIVEPSQSILGERKTPEQIIESIDYDIVED